MKKDITVSFDNNDIVPTLFGEYNDHLHYLEKKLDIHISDRGNLLRITGHKDNIHGAEIILRSLYTRLCDKELQNITHADIDAEIRFLHTGHTSSNKKKSAHNKDQNDKPAQTIVIKTKNKTIVPRSPNQAVYLKMLQDKEMVFGLGPAGTGKTYLAVAAGVDMYLRGKVERLILCRPAVEAGENLGFLPGDMKEKIDPYIRPIYDALKDMLPWEFLTKKMEIGEIEIAPLAYMRGRTLSHAFVILDEAQNATPTQMKMFLTRMGEGSHMVITGDESQSDLPKNQKSGLVDAIEILEDEDEIGFTKFEASDVIRHHIVQRIILAYDRHKTK